MVQIIFKPIIPPEINPELYKLVVLKALDREVQIDKRMLQKTTTTWKKPRPVFKTKSKVSEREGAVGRVWTEDDKWNWIDQGTPARTITPKRGKYLTFQVGGKPKTKVRTLGSGRGSRGKKWVRVKRVRKHKIKARKWNAEVVKRRKRFFTRDMRKANKKGARRAARGR